MNLNSNSAIFFQGNTFENVTCRDSVNDTMPTPSDLHNTIPSVVNLVDDVNISRNHGIQVMIIERVCDPCVGNKCR